MKKELTDKEKQDMVEQFNARFIAGHALAIMDWKIKNPKQEPPIYKDKEGYLRWANREQRKLARQALRQRK